MNHISDDNLIKIANIVSNHLYANEEIISMMDHMKTCPDCYNQLCNYIAINDATNSIGMSIISNVIREKIKEANTASISDTVLATFKIIKNQINERVSYVIEQIHQNECILFFDQPLALATRGGLASEDKDIIYKLEDIENEQTFIVYDAANKELMVQIYDETDSKYILCVNNNEIEFVKQSLFYTAKSQNVNENDEIIIKQK